MLTTTRRFSLIASLAASLALGACQKSGDTTSAPADEPAGEPPSAMEQAPPPPQPPPPQQDPPPAPPPAQGQALGGAQPGQPAGAPGAPAGESEVKIGDSELDTFAEAYVALAEVKSQFQVRMNGAETAEQAQLIQQEAETAMAQELEEQGLSWDEYTRIAMRVEQDPALQERLQTKLQEQGAL